MGAGSRTVFEEEFSHRRVAAQGGGVDRHDADIVAGHELCPCLYQHLACWFPSDGWPGLEEINSGPSLTCTRVAKYCGKVKRGVLSIRF